MKQLGIGICGLGTVGSSVFNLLRDNGPEMSRKTGVEFRIVQVGCRRDPEGCDVSAANVTRDIFDVAKHPDVEVLVELIGGTDVAFDLVTMALEAGKHVVTANKALIAERGDELFAAAERAGVSIRYEAAIAGGIPVVKAVREGLAGNRIDFIAGIINGTSNFILTQMEQAGNRGFDEVLAEAQVLGYAEADPTFDVEGIDAAHKLTILSSIAFGVPLRFDAIYTEGIGTITPADIRYAGELGFCIKHLGVTRRRDDGVELRVHPTLIRRDSMLGQVRGVMNAVLVGAEPCGETMYYGAGAGGGPTASAVVADIVDVARAPDGVANFGFLTQNLTPLPVLPIEQTECCFYLRMMVLDKAGVLARISTILSQHNISIESLIQKDAREGHAPIVIVTDEVGEASFDAAVKELQSLPEVEGQITRIRVESL